MENSAAEVLFVCTGNYYRSRFAAIYFNFLMDKKQSLLKATSRGLRIQNPKNIGPLSPLVIDYLQLLQIPIPSAIPPKKQLVEADLLNHPYVILMDREEHLPMMEEKFPHFTETVTFWSFPDVYITSHGIILPNIKAKVDQLVLDLTN